MGKFGKTWNQEEDEFLIKNYPHNGSKFCSEHLNRTTCSIRQRAQILNLLMTKEGRNGLIRKYKKEDMELAVKNSYCISDICRYFGLYPQAGNYNNFKKLITYYNINTDHFLSKSELSKQRASINSFTYKSIESILVKDSPYGRKELKKRLFKEGLLENKCSLCGQDENWRGKKMTLILDHINGINNDNRIENLQIVCPNCNATLDTFCSKNRKIKAKDIKIKNNRIPLKDDLISDFKELNSFVRVGKKYNVSDNAVRKWCKKYGLLEIIKNKQWVV